MLLLCYRFVKCWNRGENSCSRCDFEYMPVPNSSHSYPRDSESVKSCVTGSCKPPNDKQMDIKKEEKVQVCTRVLLLPCRLILIIIIIIIIITEFI